MRFTKIFILLSIPSLASASLPKLMTKQSINNIRFLSGNGKVTYYQNDSGELKYSTNYKVELISKAPAQTHYIVTASPDEKWVGVERYLNPHRPLPGAGSHQLFIAKFGDKMLTPIGEGKNIKFHLQNKYISFFSPKTGEIHIKQVTDIDDTRTVKLFSNTNVAFTPSTDLITDNDLVYIDINSKGVPAILVNSLVEKKINTIYKAQSSQFKIEYCFRKNHLIIGEFPWFDLDLPSRIMKVDLYNNPSYSRVEMLYNSPIADIGNVVCTDTAVYFIKTLENNSTLNSRVTDVAKIDLKTSLLSMISKDGDLTQLMKLSKYILAPKNGEYFIVSGKASLVDDSIKKGNQ